MAGEAYFYEFFRESLATYCAPQKLDPSLIPQFRPARIGRFVANG